MSTSKGVLMWHNSDPVVYCEPGRDPVELRAILGYSETSESEAGDRRRQRLVRDVTVCTDPDSPHGGIAAPALHGWFEINEVEYSVKRIISTSGTFVRIEVDQTKAIERGRPGLRRT